MRNENNNVEAAKHDSILDCVCAQNKNAPTIQDCDEAPEDNTNDDNGADGNEDNEPNGGRDCNCVDFLFCDYIQTTRTNPNQGKCLHCNDYNPNDPRLNERSQQDFDTRCYVPGDTEISVVGIVFLLIPVCCLICCCKLCCMMKKQVARGLTARGAVFSERNNNYGPGVGAIEMNHGSVHMPTFVPGFFSQPQPLPQQQQQQQVGFDMNMDGKVDMMANVPIGMQPVDLTGDGVINNFVPVAVALPVSATPGMNYGGPPQSGPPPAYMNAPPSYDAPTYN